MADETTEIVIPQQSEPEAPLPTAVQLRHPAATLSFEETWKMAKVVGEAGLFQLKNPREAMGLMLLCQSEGLHPMEAVKRYHIIHGRPSMRADAMLAEFQARGGRVRWVERSNDAVEAVFSHPSGGEGAIRWTAADARAAGLSTDTWRKYPRQMLTARVISEGVRLILPGVVAGIYTPEEVEEVEEFAPPPPPHVRARPHAEPNPNPQPMAKPSSKASGGKPAATPEEVAPIETLKRELSAAKARWASDGAKVTVEDLAPLWEYLSGRRKRAISGAKDVGGKDLSEACMAIALGREEILLRLANERAMDEARAAKLEAAREALAEAEGTAAVEG